MGELAALRDKLKFGSTERVAVDVGVGVAVGGRGGVDVAVGVGVVNVAV